MFRNPYTALLGLLPRTPLLVGEVVAYSGGLATIELPDGSTLQARGAATVGQRVFFRDGAIEGLAPSLTLETIDI